MSDQGFAVVARKARPWLWVGVGLSAIGLFALSRMQRGQAGAAAIPAADPAVAAALASMKIPEFQLLSQAGQMVGRDIFQDRWTILDFGFSHCTMACPVLSQNMSTAAYELRDTPVRIVTISVDPSHDTALRLQEYAKEIGADLSRWTFLTEAGATPGEVRKIAVDSLGFMLEDDPSNQIHMPSGATMNNIAHPTRFLVIGPDVTVRGIYRGNEPAEVSRMVAELREWTKGLR